MAYTPVSKRNKKASIFANISRGAQSTPTGSFIPRGKQSPLVQQSRIPVYGEGTNIRKPVKKIPDVVLKGGRTTGPVSTTPVFRKGVDQTTGQALLGALEGYDYAIGGLSQLPARGAALALRQQQPKATTFSQQAMEAAGVGQDKPVLGKASPALGFAVGMIGDPLNLITGGGASAAKLFKAVSIANKAEDVATLMRSAGYADDVIKSYAPTLTKIKDVKEVERGLTAAAKLQNETKSASRYTPVAQRTKPTGATVQATDDLAHIKDKRSLYQFAEEESSFIPYNKIDITDEIRIAAKDVSIGEKSHSKLPILVEKMPNGKYDVIDGKHRFVQQANDGVQDFLAITDKKLYERLAEIEDTLQTVVKAHPRTGTGGVKSFVRKAKEALKDQRGMVKNPFVKQVDEAVDELTTRIEIKTDTLRAHPAQPLKKFRTRSTGLLPEGGITKHGERGTKFERRGDDLAKTAGYDNTEDARKGVEDLLQQEDELKALKAELKTTKATKKVTAHKAKEQRKITRAEARGEKVGAKKEAKKISDRRLKLRAVQDRFLLDNKQMSKIRANRDFRAMDERTFDNFIAELERKGAEEFAQTEARAQVKGTIYQKEFVKEDNLRRAMELPPLTKMSSKQLQEYDAALSQYEQGSEFLTPRTLEVIDRTSLKGVRTLQGVQKHLLQNIEKQTGKKLTIQELKDSVKVSGWDNVRYDSSLAGKNPFYEYIVLRTQTHILGGQTNYLTKVEPDVFDLAKKARKSRKRGIIGSIKQTFIPQHTEIIEYLEAPLESKAVYAKALTKEELEYAKYVEDYYSKAYDHLVAVKELYGSRFVDSYFTHTRKLFLEKWADDGIVQAIRNMWQANKEDRMVANIIDDDTGNILPKSKFFQYSMQRTGEVDPSQNLTRVFLQYSKMFERKKMFDKMIPEIDVYTQSLTPKNLTPNGLETDRQLKKFINKYLNNKKGRKENFGGVIKQGEFADIAMRMGNTFVSIRDLGLNIGASLASTVGEQMMTYQALGKIKYAKAWKRRMWDTGIKRMTDPNAGKILKEAEPFIGKNIWTELAEPDKGIGERALQGLFGIFAQSSAEANKIFLLGSLSPSEIKTGRISAKRMAELRLSAGRWRDMGKDVKSIVGSTSLGGMGTKYKGWAIPIARTNIDNITKLSKQLLARDIKGLVTSKEFAETYRAIEMSTILVLVGAYVLSEEKDESFIGKLKSRAYMEAMTMLGGTDPTLFLSTPRLVSFLQTLAVNLKKIAMLETYQQGGVWGDEGDSTGVAGLERQFTPAAVSQFKAPAEKKKKRTRVQTPSGLPGLPSIDLPLPKLPKLPTI